MSFKIQGKWLGLICLGTVLSMGCNLFDIKGLVRAESRQPVPDALLKCLPEMRQYQNRYVFAESKNGDTSYFLVAVNDYNPILNQEGAPPVPQAKQYWQVVASLTNQNVCRVLIHRGDYLTTTMAVLPKSVAQQFALQQLKRDIQVSGGIAKFQASLDQDAQNAGEFSRSRNSPSKYEIAPELAWAYQQVGIKLPPNAVVLPVPARSPKMLEKL